jgi:hypothetical protein
MKHYIWNVLNEDLLLKQNIQSCMELICYDSVCIRMKRSRQSYHDQMIEIVTGQAMLKHVRLRKDRMFDFLQKMMLTLPIDQLFFGIGSGLIDCKLNPVLLLDFHEMQDHWALFERAQEMHIMIVTRTKARQETALLFSGLLEKPNNNPNLLCHPIE